jgi:hypothetical protein
VNRERQKLIEDVFGGPEFASARGETLRRGGRVLRRRRFVRRARSAAWGVAAFLVPLLLVRNASLHKPVNLARVGGPALQDSGDRIAVLSDDELLALFPNTPVALAKIHGKKRLIFLRPEDEARYLGRNPPR